jgi:hypothetical protein
MLQSLATFIARKSVTKNNATRKKQFLDWNKIEKIALILDNEVQLNKSEIDKFTSKLEKYVDVYSLELNSKTPAFGDWICFTKKDRSWLGLPKEHVDSSIKNRNYQLVINASKKYSLFAAAVVSKIGAPYSCGLQDVFGETDLIIEKKDAINITSYLGEVQKYLQMIRTV